MREEEIIIILYKEVGEFNKIIVGDSYRIGIECLYVPPLNEKLLDIFQNEFIAVWFIEEFLRILLTRMKGDVIIVKGDSQHKWNITSRYGDLPSFGCSDFWSIVFILLLCSLLLLKFIEVVLNFTCKLFVELIQDCFVSLKISWSLIHFQILLVMHRRFLLILLILLICMLGCIYFIIHLFIFILICILILRIVVIFLEHTISILFRRIVLFFLRLII